MTRRHLVIATIALLAAPAIAQTQTPAPAPHSSDIIVTAQRPSTKAEIRHLTRQIMPVGDVTEAVARFNEPVCAQSIGMEPAFDDRVAARIMDDARTAGITVGKAGCQPNITVVFIDSGQALVREIRRTHPGMFGDLDAHAVARLVNDPGPIHSWTLTETTSRDGDKMRVGTTTGIRAPELQVRSASLIELPTKRDIVATIVIVDIPAAMGKGLDQIADYAAMRTLAETRGSASAAGTADTILRLFDAGDRSPPSALTTFDRSYLRSLYEGQATTPQFAKVNQMAERINKALAGAVEKKK